MYNNNTDLASVPYLLSIAQTLRPTVSNVVLTWRMSNLGGERHCRQYLKWLNSNGLIMLSVEAEKDRREKSVKLTDKGYKVLSELYRSLSLMVELSPNSNTSLPPRMPVKDNDQEV
jgi:hypothetical protein